MEPRILGLGCSSIMDEGALKTWDNNFQSNSIGQTTCQWINILGINKHEKLDHSANPSKLMQMDMFVCCWAMHGPYPGNNGGFNELEEVQWQCHPLEVGTTETVKTNELN